VAQGICSKHVQRKLFWKLALTFLALLLSVLLAVDFLAERALRKNYESDGFRQLQALSRIIRLQPLVLSSVPPKTPEDIATLNNWVASAASSGARVSIITTEGRVLADSQTEPSTMENHLDRPEVRDALQKGEGRSIRQSVSVNRPLLYYAVRENIVGDTPIIVRLALPMEDVDSQLGIFRTKLWHGRYARSFRIFAESDGFAIGSDDSNTDGRAKFIVRDFGFDGGRRGGC
jgi:two-component system phosphate regulon sensor histidine kinase PhoR